MNTSTRENTKIEAAAFDRLVHSRRTEKAFDPTPLDTDTLDELFELARWAPNHNLTNPWRFRVLGERARENLKAAGDPQDAAKLDRAPTLIVASVLKSGTDVVRDQEDYAAASCATFIILLAAQVRGFSGYWRTPAVLRTASGRIACGVGDNEEVLGLIHLGYGKGSTKQAPERADLDVYREYLG